MTAQRNVLFIVMDQFRADCLWGDLAPHLSLPNLRRLMARGVSFTRHYSVTSPCGPSRVSLLTGQYAMNNRAERNGTPLRHDTPNLATEMRAGGYEPLLYGYTDCAQDPRALPEGDPRLYSYEELMPGFTEVVRQRLDENGGPWREDLAAKGYDLPDHAALYRPSGPEIDDPAPYAAEDSDTAFLTDRLLADLAGRAPGWFAHVTYIRPHPPFVAPAPYNRMYDRASMPAPASNDGPAHPFDAPARAHAPMASTLKGFDNLPEDADAVSRIRAVYFGLTTEVDAHIGRLLDHLDEAGLAEETLIVFTADHGEMLGDHGLWGKATYHDAAYHTPLIICDPTRPAQHGTSVAAFTESVDIAPTILALCGCAAPPTMDGHSLVPFLGGAMPEDWRDYSWSELDFGDPVAPTVLQKGLGLKAHEANLAILREAGRSLVQFAAELPPIVCGPSGRPLPDPGAALGELTQKMLRHRMTHPDGLFARTMITERGPVQAPPPDAAAVTPLSPSTVQEGGSQRSIKARPKAETAAT